MTIPERVVAKAIEGGWDGHNFYTQGDIERGDEKRGRVFKIKTL